MEIQRVKFLLLASAIAAPACTVNETNVTVPPDGAVSTGGFTNGTGGASTGGTPSTGGVANTGGSTGGTDGSVEGTDGSAGAGGTDGAVEGTGGGDAGKAKDGGKPPADAAITIDADRPDSGACNDDTIQGTLPDCSRFQADACTYADFEVGECTGAKATMKPFIAKLTIDCMVDHAACDPTATYACKDQALRLACPDPTADADCTTIHNGCASAPLDLCKTYLSGMTQAGRTKMVTCMQTDCSFGLYSCVEGLR